MQSSTVGALLSLWGTEGTQLKGMELRGTDSADLWKGRCTVCRHEGCRAQGHGGCTTHRYRGCKVLRYTVVSLCHEHYIIFELCGTDDAEHESRA